MWFGQTLSSLGSAMTNFAVVLQVYLLTHSSAAVGGVGLAIAVPAIAFGLFGGHDRRRRRSAPTRAGDPDLPDGGVGRVRDPGLRRWLGCSGCSTRSPRSQALIASINAPARRTFMPRLLPAEQIPAGAALTMLTMHISVLAGPLLAGLIVPVGGLKTCYVIDAVSFIAALYGVFRLPPMRPEGESLRPGLRAVVDGLRFLGQQPRAHRRAARRRERDAAGHADRAVPGDQRRAVRRLGAHARVAQRRPRDRRCAGDGVLRTGGTDPAARAGRAGVRRDLGRGARRVRARGRTARDDGLPRRSPAWPT